MFGDNSDSHCTYLLEETGQSPEMGAAQQRFGKRQNSWLVHDMASVCLLTDSQFKLAFRMAVSLIAGSFGVFLLLGGGGVVTGSFGWGGGHRV